MRLVVNNELIDLKVEPEYGFIRCTDLIQLLNRVVEEQGDVEIRTWDESIQDYRPIESAEFMVAIKDLNFVGLI